MNIIKNYIPDPTTESSFQVVLTLMELLYSVLQLTDRQGCTIGLLYEFMRRSKDVLAKGVEENIPHKSKFHIYFNLLWFPKIKPSIVCSCFKIDSLVIPF